MTVSSSTSRVQYNCTGALTDFDFTFGVNDETEIEVILTDASGTDTTLTLTTEYTVAATNDDFSSGGTVTTVATYAAGNTLTVLRDVPLTQEADFTENQATLYETFEDGLDKLTRLVQQINELLQRCLSFAKSSAYTGDETVPDPEALKYLRWNTAAKALENAELVIAGDLTAHAVDANAHSQAPQAVTISAGELDLSGNTTNDYFTVSSEVGVADALTKISGLGSGDKVILKPATGHTITVTAGADIVMVTDFVMQSIYDRIGLQCIGGDVWVQLYRSSNA